MVGVYLPQWFRTCWGVFSTFLYVLFIHIYSKWLSFLFLCFRCSIEFSFGVLGMRGPVSKSVSMNKTGCFFFLWKTLGLSNSLFEFPRCALWISVEEVPCGLLQQLPNHWRVALLRSSCLGPFRVQPKTCKAYGCRCGQVKIGVSWWFWF